MVGRSSVMMSLRNQSAGQRFASTRATCYGASMSTSAAQRRHPHVQNRLARETSPYLLQHQHNPVDWWAWGPEALAEAKRTNKPILLSVGYAACHWCHVMAHESFEDDATARGDERAVRQHQGRPRGAARHRSDLHGGAASSRRAGRLAADHVPHARRRADLGRHLFSQDVALRQTGLRRRAARGRAAVPRGAAEDRAKPRRADGAARRDGAASPAPSTIGVAELDNAARQLGGIIDPVNGGIARRAEISASGVLRIAVARRAAHRRSALFRAPSSITLDHICEGGIYDHLGGGFSRYSVDERWLVPHFEKMLYDNAQLLELLAIAYRRSGKPLYRAARARDRRVARRAK